MEVVPLTLTDQQAKRLLKGLTVQLKHHQIAPGVQHAHALSLHPHTAKRLHRAARLSKGCRLSMTNPEIEGSGLFDWVRGASKWVKNNVIDSKAYQQLAKPVVRQLVNTAVDNFVPSGIARDAAKDAVNYIGEKTSAFGLKRPTQAQEVMAISQRTYSPLIASSHPANNPREITLPAPGLKGGSFRAGSVKYESPKKRGRGRPRK